MNTVFFCINDAYTGPLIQQITKYGGIFVEADFPSSIVGYPEAFDLDLTNYVGIGL
ncbi:MAG: DUF3798 domain-containing protein [Deltaproteobacteria bacterium]|nr:DUF3798 domain-containing protein [Deltaproteobacteria bacterium]